MELSTGLGIRSPSADSRIATAQALRIGPPQTRRLLTARLTPKLLIWIDPKPMENLPSEPGPSDMDACKPPESEARPASEIPHKIRVLLVDDEEIILSLVRRALTRAGYEVDTARDGEEGWTLLQQNRYDLLLTDNQMPNLTGIELLQRIQDSKSNIPCVLVSGKLDFLTPAELNLISHVILLAKPFTPLQLTQAMESALARQPG